MNSIAHARPGLAPPRGTGPDRPALHAAIPVETRSLVDRLRHPFTRRSPTVASLIRKHRLQTALEFVHDELVREFGSVRIRLEIQEDLQQRPYVSLHAELPTLDMDRALDFESGLRTRVRRDFARSTRPGLLITLHPDRTSTDVVRS
jgi:hypothetical protein